MKLFPFLTFFFSLMTGTISESIPELVISKPIIISSNQHIDFGNRRIFLKDHANCPAIIIGSTDLEPITVTSNVIIENLWLDGNAQNQDYEIWKNEDNSIRNNGISIRHCYNVTIRNSTILNCRSGNIVIEKKCQNITIENCFLSKAFFDGIACYDSTKCKLIDNRIVDNAYAGLSFDIHFNNNSVKNNFIIGNNLGVFLRDCSDNEFVDNFLKNKEYDFYLNQVDDNITTLPHHNTFSGNISEKDSIFQRKD